jgi:hypothetical protein
LAIIEKYQELVEKCKDYPIIYVTGPQRSGTTFCSNMLAKDLQYKWVDESRFGTHSFRRFKSFLKEGHVVQCPALSYNVAKFDSKGLIVWMRRSLQDVIKSEDRINWHPKEFEVEKKKYLDTFPNYKDKIENFNRSKPMKDFFWENVQKDYLNIEYVEFNYKALKESTGWVNKEKRVKFRSKQIK